MTEAEIREPLVDRIAKAMQRSVTGREAGWAENVTTAYAILAAIREPNLAMRKVCSFSEAEVVWPIMVKAAEQEASRADDVVDQDEW